MMATSDGSFVTSRSGRRRLRIGTRMRVNDMVRRRCYWSEVALGREECGQSKRWRQWQRGEGGVWLEKKREAVVERGGSRAKVSRWVVEIRDE
ncbi:hypothetical protein ACLOJK_004906 [Asimina triloba]